MSKNLNVKYEGKPCYNIRVESSFSSLEKSLREDLDNLQRKVCIVTDSHVAALYLDEIASICGDLFTKVISFVFPAGEASKNMDTVQKLYLSLIENHFDRGDLLIALGGGVVGDLTGFAAATYLRGIDFLQIPTTLLAQVDSSIGGKTGVDFQQYKNMVGAFHMPRMVYMNTATLNTLPAEQFSSGMAEIIKHGLIRDEAYYRWISDHREGICGLDPELLEEMIYRSCQIKGSVVEEDPKEKGVRAHLNFGHTVGHAVEKLSDFRLSHGYSVALGMKAAAYLSKKLGYLSGEDISEMLSVFASFGLPVSLPLEEDSREILQATKSDKKMAGKQIKFIILTAVGTAQIYREFTDEDLLEAIDYMKSDVPETAGSVAKKTNAEETGL